MVEIALKDEVVALSADDVRFERLNLRNADLRGAKLHDVTLAKARLDDVSLRDVHISNADIRGLTINGVRIDRLLESRDTVSPKAQKKR